MMMVQFALPERVGASCAEAATVIAGGATLIQGLGWWVNGDGEIVREKIQWLIVGVGESQIDRVVGVIKEILRREGESAIFYVVGNEPRIEYLQ
jgi:hypothetical protein